MHFDVFNGDADGLCALLQLRLDKPLDSVLVTGVKRDISLLNKVQVEAGDSVTVLDISLEKNITALERILSQGASVFYVDHHRSGDIPQHSQLETRINTDANICTSLLVDQFLEGRYRAWAVTAAFGDNMLDSAKHKAACLNLTKQKLDVLKELGVCINYNGYGGSLDDLHFLPDELYQQMLPYSSPFDFIVDNNDIYQQLRNGYYEDMTKAKAISATIENDNIALYILPDEVWSRRVGGVFGNELANAYPNRAHAVLTTNAQGAYMVSVRAPLVNKEGADTLCASFATGGGRKGAAGINHLPVNDLERFISCFSKQYSDAC